MKLLTILLIVAAIIIGYKLLKQNESYRYLKGMYLPAQGGYRAEVNEECLTLQAGQQCVLTDGTSGNCVLSGHCVANMLIDLNKENQELKKPYCTEPVFKENCGMFAQCKLMQGSITKDGLNRMKQECESWFSPL